MIEVPVAATAAQSFTTQLGEVRLVFDIQWNDRSQTFGLTLTNEDTGFVYVQGVALVLGANLLEPYNFGLGALFVMDGTREGLEPTPDNFGDTVKLYWLSEQEVADAISSAV